MTHFHPDDSLLIEYANGALHKAKAICVASHLAYCHQCMAQVKKMDSLSGRLMSSLAVPTNEDLLEKTLAKIDTVSTTKTNAQIPQLPREFAAMPGVVRKLISATPDSRWRKITASMDTARLKTGQQDYEVSLQKICAGGKTPLHDHRGDEYTVVLQGSFSDERGVYGPGDFIHNKPGDSHQPLGALHEDCICLSALSAPIKLKSPLGWLLAPWLRIKPM